MKYQFGPFSAIFGLMKSKLSKKPKKSKFWDGDFKKYWFTSNFLLLLLSSFYRHWFMKYKFGPFLTQFWDNDVQFQYFDKLVTEINSPHFKVLSNIDFDLSIALDTWYITFDPFLPNLEIMTSQKKYIFHNFEKLTKKLDLIS